MNYAMIKSAASMSSISVGDLLAMSPKNDPFYCGTRRDRLMAEWFGRIWKQAGYTTNVHLRRVHYWCVSRRPTIHTGEPYLNTDKCWKYLTQASKCARYLEIINIDDIADHKNPNPMVHAMYNTGYQRPTFSIEPVEISEPYVGLGMRKYDDIMPVASEVWVEKSTMNDVLAPVCERYHANLCTFQGEASITAVNDMLNRLIVANRPARIFYISDFDPAGNSMAKAVARKLEWMMHKQGIDLDVKVTQLLLTPDIVQRYQLPRTPIKETERRAAKFENKFGSGGVELDALEALHPGVIASILEDALEPYYDDEAARLARSAWQEASAEVWSKVNAITSRYEKEISALDKMAEELLAIEADISGSHLNRRSMDDLEELDESERFWLFDSSRNYVEQIEAYKIHAGEL